MKGLHHGGTENTEKSTRRKTCRNAQPACRRSGHPDERFAAFPPCTSPCSPCLRGEALPRRFPSAPRSCIIEPASQVPSHGGTAVFPVAKGTESLNVWSC